MALFWALFLALVAGAHAEIPGCKLRITSQALDLVKQEGLRFLEQELETITIPDLGGREGHFVYNISEVKVIELQLMSSKLHFQPEQDLVLQISNASLRLGFQRQLLYWFFYDGGYINASAEGISIRTALQLSGDASGRIKVANVSCEASVSRMRAAFGGTFGKVYEILSTFITSGMRFLLNQQICPVLYHAGTVLLNSLLDTVPVRSPVDNLVGIDYSILKDPEVSTSNLDMDFRGAFYPLAQGNRSFPNRAVEPQLQEDERMVYVAFSEFFFDSALESYFRAGALKLSLAGDKVPHDLDMLLRASYFGSIVLQSPAVIDSPLKLELKVLEAPHCTIKPSGTTITVTASVSIALVPPNLPEVQLSSMIMDARLSAKVALQGKALRIHLDLRKFRIYSNHSAFESLALIPLQAPLKTMLQLGVMPLINERTRRGVQIPLPEGMDFVREVVTNHAGFLTIGADLHFAKGLREVIEKKRPAATRGSPTSRAPPPSRPRSMPPSTPSSTPPSTPSSTPPSMPPPMAGA
ncbi:phospholipid transfer protein [Phyllostomus hastatus]|uniref:phospholipid transfer protein n=1 Tax=Phyllostomus hastatus TaxID=9423 RepID=UPI001E681149|nr:phospholipid transfer protein [Phyllostomus hastatus]XP_045688734.1 phospholipid transfer protein [Phyllostomus hastatus]